MKKIIHGHIFTLTCGLKNIKIDLLPRNNMYTQFFKIIGNLLQDDIGVVGGVTFPV